MDWRPKRSSDGGFQKRTLSNVEGESSDTLLHQDSEVITAVGSNDTKTDGGRDDEGHSDGVKDPRDGRDDEGIKAEVRLRLLSNSQRISAQWLRKTLFGFQSESGNEQRSNP